MAEKERKFTGEKGCSGKRLLSGRQWLFTVHSQVVGSWERGLQAASAWASQRISRILPRPGNELQRSAV